MFIPQENMAGPQGCFPVFQAPGGSSGETPWDRQPWLLLWAEGRQQEKAGGVPMGQEC